MSDEASAENVASYLNQVFTQEILQLLPFPSCPIARQRMEVKHTEVKKKLIKKLGGIEGISINV